MSTKNVKLQFLIVKEKHQIKDFQQILIFLGLIQNYFLSKNHCKQNQSLIQKIKINQTFLYQQQSLNNIIQNTKQIRSLRLKIEIKNSILLLIINLRFNYKFKVYLTLTLKQQLILIYFIFFHLFLQNIINLIHHLSHNQNIEQVQYKKMTEIIRNLTESQNNLSQQKLKQLSSSALYKSSISLNSNYKRLRRIQNKTLSIVNKYLQKIPKLSPPLKNSLFQNKNSILNNRNTEENQQMKIRSHSQPIDSHYNNYKQLENFRLYVQKNKQNTKNYKLSNKINKVKIESNILTKQIEAQHKLSIEKHANLHLMGNQWMLNRPDPLKLQWRKINQRQARSARAGSSVQFFIRNTTTNYETQKSRIHQRIKTINQTRRRNSQSQNRKNSTKSNLLQKPKQSSKQNLNQNRIHKTKNKFPSIDSKQNKLSSKKFREKTNLDLKAIKEQKQENIDKKVLTEKEEKVSKRQIFQPLGIIQLPLRMKSKSKTYPQNFSFPIGKDLIKMDNNRRKLRL